MYRGIELGMAKAVAIHERGVNLALDGEDVSLGNPINVLESD
jgi:hypothetical protein